MYGVEDGTVLAVFGDSAYSTHLTSTHSLDQLINPPRHYQTSIFDHVTNSTANSAFSKGTVLHVCSVHVHISLPKRERERESLDLQ